MHAVSSRAEALRAALLAAAAAALLVALAPPGGDSAAHLYRTMLVRDGVHVWDNLWYGGQYPLTSYSLLYYLPAALLGNVPVVVAAVVGSAALFASLAVRQWGPAARWPARAFGVLAAGPLFTGQYSYAVGLAFALAALWLLQGERTWAAVAAGALALGFSALAFAFLCVALAAMAVARGTLERRTVAVALGLAAAVGIQLLTLAAFPAEGRYPFSPLSLGGVLAVSVLGAALAYRSQRAGALAAFFVLWGMANLAAFLVPSPFGDNLARLREVAFPLVLLAAALARFRPRPLAAAALAVALVYNVAPDLRALPHRTKDARTADAAFWEPALAFLRSHSTPDYRVEVVPTFGHWEAYWVPRAGFALARGWYRQLDLAQNPQLYRDPLSAREYERWLRRLGVRYVLLPDARLGPLGADREAELLMSGRGGLRRVFADGTWTIFELPRATPIMTGPAPARIHRFGHERIEATVGAPGVYRLRVRHTPYWRSPPGVCLRPAPGGATSVLASRAGRFTLMLAESPGALLRSALREPRC
ncbi:MAG: hypothetical protein ICV64_02320 [Thermoleophilia bacterium]|nr:hypothetical protein [Thermoleophilia bacterium]